VNYHPKDVILKVENCYNTDNQYKNNDNNQYTDNHNNNHENGCHQNQNKTQKIILPVRLDARIHSPAEFRSTYESEGVPVIFYNGTSPSNYFGPIIHHQHLNDCGDDNHNHDIDHDVNSIIDHDNNNNNNNNNNKRNVRLRDSKRHSYSYTRTLKPTHHPHWMIWIDDYGPSWFITLVALGCSYSRVHLGYHTPIQVFAGACLGIILGCVFFNIYISNL